MSTRLKYAAIPAVAVVIAAGWSLADTTGVFSPVTQGGFYDAASEQNFARTDYSITSETRQGETQERTLISSAPSAEAPSLPGASAAGSSTQPGSGSSSGSAESSEGGSTGSSEVGTEIEAQAPVVDTPTVTTPDAPMSGGNAPSSSGNTVVEVETPVVSGGAEASVDVGGDTGGPVEIETEVEVKTEKVTQKVAETVDETLEKVDSTVGGLLGH